MGSTFQKLRSLYVNTTENLKWQFEYNQNDPTSKMIRILTSVSVVYVDS